MKLDKNEDFSQGLHIKSKGGDDKIRIDPNVDVTVTVEGGRGRDKIEALGSGNTHVYGGAGDDDITLGSGVGYAEGNNGNDNLKGGTGKSVMYGNNGNDRMFSGPGSKGTFSYMDGGKGKDVIVSESPFNLVHGGPDEDLMIGKAPTTFYTGRGRDIVLSAFAGDKIYADAGDRISRIPGSTLKQVTISNAGNKGLNIEGSEKFKQRTQDDLEFLRNSPTAQKVLTELDKAAKRNGSPVNIKETLEGSPNYSFVNDFTKKMDSELKDYDGIEETAPLGFITNNVSGSVATDANIHHNHKIFFNDDDTPPIVGLFHELAHAYNGANGTLLGGTTPAGEDAFPEPNLERQAIGLETNAPAFDFDNDPATPLTTTNPKPFTENALREETGFPLREKVYVIPSE
ncbi:hypothetical protein HZF02_06840 [Pseudomonas yamanorum]|nr:hypothetical protein HZF02_06840 [Pseudomonas yamanorum]